MTGPASAQISGHAVATGRFSGEAVRSQGADSSVAVQPATPDLSVDVTAEIRDGDGLPGPSIGDPVVLTIHVGNSGDIALGGISADAAIMQGDETYLLAERPQVESGDGARPGVLDRGETWLLSADYALAVENFENGRPMVVTVNVSGAFRGQSAKGQATVTVELPPLQDIPPERLSIAHSTNVREAAPGDRIDYTITVSNRSDRRLSARLTAMLSENVEYIAGSALLDGDVIEPGVSGPKLDFGEIAVNAGGEASVRYLGTVKDLAVRGYYTSIARISDPRSGVALIPPADATVQADGPPQGGCTGISLLIFDDLNRDGVLDPGEGGISGVRVLMEDQGPLTTDPEGRFFSPCATVSRLADIDLRFALNERTLPDGYFLTTENPVSIQAVRGETVNVTFGASEARIVRVDLNAAAFARNKAAPDAETADSITRLISVLGREPAILRLTYYAHREARDLPRQRLAAMRQMVLDRWVASGGSYELEVETRVVESDG